MKIWGNLKYTPHTSWLLWCMILLFNLWSLSWIEHKIFQFAHILILSFFFITLLKKRIKISSTIFSHWILLFMLLPLLSIPACKILHDQSIVDSLIVYRMHLGWLLYFVLLSKKVTEQQLIYVTICMALIYSLIVLLQQITYPFAPFGERTLGSDYAIRFFSNSVERRFGFYRFSVGGYVFAVLALLLYLAHRWRINKITVAFLVLSIIATGNRQTIASAFLTTSFYYIFNQKKKYRLFYFALLTCFICIICYYSTSLWGSLANVTDDLEEGRMHSYLYYYDQVTDNPIALLCGNGLPSSNSVYGQTPDVFMNKVVTPSDIGILGTWYYWGGIYVCSYLIFMIRLFLNKHADFFLKAYALFFLLTIWVSSPLWEIWGISLQAMFIYYCELNIRRNKNLDTRQKKTSINVNGLND